MNVKPLIKDEMLVVRVTSAFKATLQRMAEGEHRPLGNLIEHVLLGWLAQRGVEVESSSDPAAQRLGDREGPRGLAGKGLSRDAKDAPRERRRKRTAGSRERTRIVRAK